MSDNYQATKLGGKEFFLPITALQHTITAPKRKGKVEEQLPKGIDPHSVENSKVYPHYLLKGFARPEYIKETKQYFAKGIGKRSGQYAIYIPLSEVNGEELERYYIKFKNSEHSYVNLELTDRVHTYVMELLNHKPKTKGFWMNMRYPCKEEEHGYTFCKKEGRESKVYVSTKNYMLEEAALNMDLENNSKLMTEKAYVYAVLYAISCLEYFYFQSGYSEKNYRHSKDGHFYVQCLTSWNNLNLYFEENVDGKKSNYNHMPTFINLADYKGNKSGKSGWYFKYHSDIDICNIPFGGNVPILVKDENADFLTMKALDSEYDSCYGLPFARSKSYANPRTFLLMYEDEKM